MSKFKKQLRMIEEALLKPMSTERIKEVDSKKVSVLIDEIKKRAKLNSTGMYDVEGDVELTWTDLTDLPMNFGIINGSFDCSNNMLTSLKGAPHKVRDNFDCSGNELTTLEGAPKEVGEAFICYGNKVKFTEEDVDVVCNAQYRYV